MLVDLNGAQFHIPDELVDHYVADFQPLRNWEHHGSLINLREEILDMFDVVLEDPEALFDPEFLEDFIQTLAMRQALIQIKILFDA